MLMLGVCMLHVHVLHFRVEKCVFDFTVSDLFIAFPTARISIWS